MCTAHAAACKPAVDAGKYHCKTFDRKHFRFRQHASAEDRVQSYHRRRWQLETLRLTSVRNLTQCSVRVSR